MRGCNPRVTAARLLIGVVLFVNLQCAVAFLASPERYAAGFELFGEPGVGLIRGIGVLFLMWNVPYAVALTDPVRRRVSLHEAVAMQSIGLVGETILVATFPDGYATLVGSVTRFIVFDGAGLAALLLAAWLVRCVISESGCGT